jgi:hypothetical protein
MPSLERCTKCRHPFCDTCLVFAVDGKPWCEPCGNALVDSVAPRWVLGGLVLAGGFGLTTALWLGRVFVHAVIPGFLVVVFLGYAGSLFAAWKVALDTTTGEKPTIERRRR